MECPSLQLVDTFGVCSVHQSISWVCQCHRWLPGVSDEPSCLYVSPDKRSPSWLAASWSTPAQKKNKNESAKQTCRLSAWSFQRNADVHILEGKQINCLNSALHPSHPVILDKLLHVILRQVIGLDVGLNKLFIGDGSQVGQLLQLHEELLEVQLHQGPALVAALLHISIATAEDKAAEGKRGGQHSKVFRQR